MRQLGGDRLDIDNHRRVHKPMTIGKPIIQLDKRRSWC